MKSDDSSEKGDTNTATTHNKNDDLDVVEIETAIADGEIIERYPHDPRGSSCLIAGHSGSKPVHIVIGWSRAMVGNGGILRVITVYIPQPPKWSDYRTRGQKP